MKTADVDSMNQVLKCLRENIPVDQDLYVAFAIAVCNYNTQLEKQKTRYQKKASYHREKTKEWTANHPEHVREYQRGWAQKNKERLKEKQSAQRKKRKKQAFS